MWRQFALLPFQFPFINSQKMHCFSYLRSSPAFHPFLLLLLHFCAQLADCGLHFPGHHSHSHSSEGYYQPPPSGSHQHHGMSGLQKVELGTAVAGGAVLANHLVQHPSEPMHNWEKLAVGAGGVAASALAVEGVQHAHQHHEQRKHEEEMWRLQQMQLHQMGQYEQPHYGFDGPIVQTYQQAMPPPQPYVDPYAQQMLPMPAYSVEQPYYQPYPNDIYGPPPEHHRHHSHWPHHRPGHNGPFGRK